MTKIERWACFLKHAKDDTKRDVINEILKNEGGIAMASSTLLTFSKDEAEMVNAKRREKLAIDWKSDLKDAERYGIEKVARNLIKQKMDVLNIAEATGLTPEEIKNLMDEE
jgi:hypothetical protein